MHDNSHDAMFAMRAFNFIMLWQWYIESRIVPDGCRYAPADSRLAPCPGTDELVAALRPICSCDMLSESVAGAKSLETAKELRGDMLARYKAVGGAPPGSQDWKQAGTRPTRCLNY